MRSIGGCIALSQTHQMGTQYNTWHIPHTAQKGSSPHDMSCPSKGIMLCQSLIGTQGKFLCNTNTRALHSKVILTHAISWPKSYNASSTLLTMMHYASAHVWRRKAYKASQITSGVLPIHPMLPYCHSSQAARDVTLTSGLTNPLCFAHISKTNGGQDKRKVDSCIGKHVGPLERGQIKCGDVEVENPISTS